MIKNAPLYPAAAAQTFNGIVTFGNAVNMAQGADIPSATTTNLETATGNLVDVTGTTTITAITLGQGHTRTVRFTGALILTNGASLVLPGAANITTAAGDIAVFAGYATSVVRCIAYQRASATPITAWATYTPTVTLVGGAGNTVPVYTTNIGRWMRIGNVVFVDVFLDGDGGAEGAGTGRVTIALPVAVGASAAGDYKIAGRASNNASRWVLYAEMVAGASTTALLIQNAATTVAAMTGDDQNNTTRLIKLSFFYEV